MEGCLVGEWPGEDRVTVLRYGLQTGKGAEQRIAEHAAEVNLIT